MSVKPSLNVAKVIRKYRDTYPRIERPLLRTLIRLEYENQTLKNSRTLDRRKEDSFLKRLDRDLDKAYPTPKTTEDPQTKTHNEHVEENETDKARAELIRAGKKALGL